MKIGFFDSGVGGLTILHCVQKRLPQHEYSYVSDSARAPYGRLPQETIITYTREKIGELWDQGATLIVLACNTASSQALKIIQAEDVPRHPGTNVLGVLIPAAEEAIARSKTQRIGVIATQATVHSNAFVREIQKINPSAAVKQWIGSDLVPLIEAGDRGSAQLRQILHLILEPIAHSSIDTLILGCTHFGHIEQLFRESLPDTISLISEGEVVAEKLASYLERHPEYE